jgi:hypothetical protein
MINSAEEKSHLEQVKDRRSQADGDRSMAELLRRGTIRRSSGTSGRPGRRPRGGLISLPDPPDLPLDQPFKDVTIRR